MKIATAFVELRADRSKMGHDLDAVEADVKTKAHSTAAVFAQVFGAAAFGAVVKGSIDAASNLNETVSKTKQLFGEDADAVIAFSKTTASSMGLSERAYLDAAAGLKGLLDNLGLAPAQATEWSQKLTQLGSDLGSFFNKDPAEAVAAIGSAMRGESEPIRAFNVQINEAAIKAKALELGLYSGTGAIDSNAKAQGTLALIMEQTTAAQGDFAKTADGAANSQRIAKATAEDSAASLGQAFLPIYTKVVQVVTALAKGFGELPGPVQVAIVALVGLIALSGPIHTGIDAVKGITTAIKGMGPAAAGAGVALGLAALAVFAWQEGVNNAKERTAEFNKSVSDLAKVADDQLGPALNKTLSTAMMQVAVDGRNMKDVFDGIAEGDLVGAKRALEWAQANGEKQFVIDGLKDAIGRKEQADKDAAAAEARLGQASSDAVPPTEDLGAAALELAQNTDLTRQAQDRAKQYTDDLAAATAEAARKSGVYSDALQRQIDQLAALYPKEYDAVTAKYDYAKQTETTMIAVGNMNTTLADHKSKQEDVKTATDNARDAIISQSEKYATLDGAVLGSEGAIRRQIESLRAQAESLAPGSSLRLYIEQYIADLANIPSNVSTILALHISADATNKNAAGYLPRFGGAGATGIDTKLGSYYRVGEGGKPEMYTENGQNYLIPGDNGQVTPFKDGSAVPSIIINNYRRDINVGDLNQVIAMARLS